MVKLMCMFKLADGVTSEELDDFYNKTHAEEVKTLKYVKKYIIGKVIESEDKNEVYYMVNALHYNTLEEAKESVSTHFAVESRNKLLKLVKDFKCMYIEEETII